MSTRAQILIEGAYEKLAKRSGFSRREGQVQLSLLLNDLIEGTATGIFEAPTGLGKSLAALIPAIAHAVANETRTVIATYTNVLAEQYWRKDLPFALSLFEELLSNDELPPCQFLIGRQRYACLASMDESSTTLADEFRKHAELGIETEFRDFYKKSPRDQIKLWQEIASPPVCPGRLCHRYNDCFYYGARKGADKATVVITNHSVVIQDALLARATEDERRLLGQYGFLILDEAHDFPQAALSGLEFELSSSRLNMIGAIASRMEKVISPLAQRARELSSWANAYQDFRAAVELCQKELAAYSLEFGQSGIFDVSPREVVDHPKVREHWASDRLDVARELTSEFAGELSSFVGHAEDTLARWKEEGGGPLVTEASETVRNYIGFLREYCEGCRNLFEPQGVAVSYASRNSHEAILRQDVIGLAEPLRELIWNRGPWACISATLALDGEFDFFKRTTGAEPDFEEILPSPFDFSTQAALYLTKPEAIPDPSAARREGQESRYYQALARELTEIILAVGGRTLALFHSRREMEEVHKLLQLPEELRVYIQTRSGAASVGERFKREISSSLFALRSFWTGFDAPGETLACVALVRVPFEVPVEPPQIARIAWMQTQGLDAFAAHSLAQAKMLMRQGSGRLIRRPEDKGVIALLDPRLRTKRYGEDILNNLPPDMRTFSDIADAVGWIGLESGALPI